MCGHEGYVLKISKVQHWLNVMLAVFNHRISPNAFWLDIVSDFNQCFNTSPGHMTLNIASLLQSDHALAESFTDRHKVSYGFSVRIQMSFLLCKGLTAKPPFYFIYLLILNFFQYNFHICIVTRKRDIWVFTYFWIIYLFIHPFYFFYEPGLKRHRYKMTRNKKYRFKFIFIHWEFSFFNSQRNRLK